MTRSLRAQGRRLLSESARILERDVSGALGDGDFNLAVRRAQEVVEFALKGALNLMCTEYPRLHDVAHLFSERATEKLEDVDAEALERIQEISLWLSQACTPALYLEQDYTVDDANRALEDARFVLAEAHRVLDLGEEATSEPPAESGEDRPPEP